MSDYPTGLSRFFQPPPPRPTPDLRLNRIADALERIADHLTRDAQPAAPDMSAALEAEYQRGWEDGATAQWVRVRQFICDSREQGHYDGSIVTRILDGEHR